MIDRIAARLPALLGDNLYSCVLYGSAVRGGIKPGTSDINLLIVLNESRPEAHRAISECVQGKIFVDPFVIARKGMERSFETFAMKFRSIRRNYRVLVGEDPLAKLEISEERARFLCEQSLRNLRLRTVHTYVMHRQDRKRYLNYLLNVYSTIVIELSEVMRLNNEDVPNNFEQRVLLIEKVFQLDVSVLHNLLKLKLNIRRLHNRDVEYFHRGLFTLLDSAVIWVEERWTMN